MADQPSGQIIGFSGFESKPLSPQAAPQPAAPLPQLKLQRNDAQKLQKLAYEENDCVEAARKAVKRREAFCLQLEKKMGIRGKTWKVDFSRGMLIVTGDKPAAMAQGQKETPEPK